MADRDEKERIDSRSRTRDSPIQSSAQIYSQGPTKTETTVITTTKTRQTRGPKNAKSSVDEQVERMMANYNGD